MKIEKWTNLIAVFANLGVVAGLVILLIQINQANKLAEANTIHQRISEIQNSLQEFALSEQLPLIYSKVSQQGFDALTPDEKSRIMAWEFARMFRMQGQYQQYRLGLLDQTSAENMLQAAAWYSENYWKFLGVFTTDRNFSEAIKKTNPVKPPGAIEFHEKAETEPKY